jgi:hypothetical protein
LRRGVTRLTGPGCAMALIVSEENDERDETVSLARRGIHRLSAITKAVKAPPGWEGMSARIRFATARDSRGSAPG